ncbi:hypothetical protein HPP92_027588 [Vanilla planifolia]|uniref:Uncharacterized protein n=1 Tax=Vanilla planifolia TaxID=51239 RepID=A0A835PEF1_VANPL|nr:hypothetical protein HPP92_027588 [Vanilla planifolia]
MAELDQSFIKYVELRLLRCTISGKLPLPPPSLFPSSNNPLAAVVDDLVDTIERGEYEAALSSGAARLVFAFADSYEFEDFPSSAARFYSEVERSMDSFLCDGIAEEAWLRVLEPRDDVNTVYRVSVVLCLGVAALLAFIQQNVTGPSRKFSRFPLMFGQLGKDDAAEIGGEWDSWARAQITSVGCDLFGKISLLQYFEYAKMILLKIQDFCRTDIFSYSNAPKTTSWWLCRLLLLQQRILDDLSSSLYNLLQVFKNETILNFGEKNSVKQYWGTLLHDNEALTVASMLQLEAGIMEYQYGRIDSSRLHLRVAAEASGTDILVTGVLGYRTVHQVDAKPQLVLVTKTGQQVNGIRRPKAPPEVQNADLGILDSKREFGELDMDAIQRVNDVKRPARLSQSQSDELLSQNKMRFQFDGDYECDILMAPRFVQDAESATDKGEFAIVGKDVVLTAIQQAIILAQCLHLQRSKRDDELSEI